MNNVPSEPAKAKRGRKPKNASLNASTVAIVPEGSATKKVGRPAGTKNRKPKTMVTPVAKKGVQTPKAEPMPKAATAAEAVPNTQKPASRPKAAKAQTAGRPVVASSVSASHAPAAKQQEANESIWKRMGFGIKVIIVLVVIGIIASLIKHF